MMVAPYRNKDGERGVLAIIGPKRMQYAKNKSLLEYVKKLLSSTSGTTLAVVLCIRVIV
jgi:transcriptional regulator of heat shock response